MSVARRLRQLRESYGETIRQAARRTGVTHVTWSNLERGKVDQACRATLEKIAAGYSVTVDYLTNGRDYAASLATYVRLCGRSRRWWITASVADRIYATVCFLLTEHGSDFSAARIAHLAALGEERLRAYVTAGAVDGLPPAMLRQLAAAVEQAAALPNCWFTLGLLSNEVTADHGTVQIHGLGLRQANDARLRGSLRPWARKMAHGVFLTT